MELKTFLRFAFATFPLLFIFGLLEIFELTNTKITVMMLVAINILLACFLFVILRTEGSESAPLGIGELIRGYTYVISISGTLMNLFIFLLALNKAIG